MKGLRRTTENIFLTGLALLAMNNQTGCDKAMVKAPRPRGTYTLHAENDHVGPALQALENELSHPENDDVLIIGDGSDKGGELADKLDNASVDVYDATNLQDEQRLEYFVEHVLANKGVHVKAGARPPFALKATKHGVIVGSDYDQEKDTVRINGVTYQASDFLTYNVDARGARQIVAAELEGVVDDSITVFGAEWCPFCHAEKEYLESEGVPYHYVSLDSGEAERAVYEALDHAGVSLPAGVRRGLPLSMNKSEKGLVVAIGFIGMTNTGVEANVSWYDVNGETRQQPLLRLSR